MKSSKRRLRPLELALLVVPLGAMAALFLWNRLRIAPPIYTVTNLGNLGDTYSLSLNDNGDMAGVWVTKGKTYATADGSRAWPALSQRPFVWSSGSVRFIPGQDGSARIINNRGQVAGITLAADYALSPETKERAFFWSNGKRQNLVTVKSAWSFVTDLNNKGDVVGYTDGSTQGFLWRRGQMEATKTTSGVAVVPNSINDQGDIAGTESGPARQAVILRASGKVQHFAPNTEVVSKINNVGAIVLKHDKVSILWRQDEKNVLFTDNDNQFLRSAILNDKNCVVGNIGNFDGASDALCLFLAGRRYDLNTLIPKNSGWELSDVYDLNNSGQIVGQGMLNGKQHFFLLTPLAS